MSQEDKKEQHEKLQRKQERYRKIKKGLIWTLIIAITLIVVYAILRYFVKLGKIDEAVFWAKFQDWAIISVIAIIALYVLVYLFTKLFDKKKEEENTNLKQYVDTVVAEKAFREQFIKGTNIPYFLNANLPDEIQTNDPEVVQIKNTTTFPEKKTGVPFFLFECHAKEGTKAGINICLTRLDKGVDHIKNNWLGNIKEHISFESYDRKEHKYPYAVPEDENTRIEVFKQQQIEDGTREQQLVYLEGLRLAKQTPSPPEISPELIELHREKQQLEMIEKINKGSK